MDTSTDTLRQLASTWTLAGDEQLLTLLQNTHKKLIQKCQEVNNQLEKMATALDDASVSLQNVNNQFMALSNTKFVERRVYDDDDVSTEPPAIKEPPTTLSPEAEMASLKQSVSVLASCHEVITIVHESDSECDSDDISPTRMILKPKDLYADRPLPYIIGSEPWKNKWHVGLVVEDSDSDSSMSEDRESEQYSSEPEEDKLTVPHRMDANISETSSELPSELPSEVEPSKPTPSDVANEIARRLGGGAPIRVEPLEPEDMEPTKPIPRKIFRPQDPITSTIFPDEPPPLDNEDIFADLHQPYSRAAPDDLFDFEQRDDDIFSELAKPADIKPATSEPTASHIKSQNVIQQPVQTPADPVEDDRSVKKPVGGISLFGSKGTESIGAAILKRNQRKSTSDEESSDTTETKETMNQNKTEKDIFNDLFAKNKPKPTKTTNLSINKDIVKEIQSKNEVKVKQDVPVKENKVDLFSDNLFDDIDDIFTNVPKTQKDNKKSIFDDTDDLFSDIAVPNTAKAETGTTSKKGIFDSDDELFTENMPKTEIKPETSTVKTDIPTVNKIKDSTSNIDNIFDDEDDIFSDININKPNVDSKIQDSSVNKKSAKKDERISQIISSPSLFDDDDDDSELFAQISKNKVTETPIFKDISISNKVVEPVIDKLPAKTIENSISIQNDNTPQETVPTVSSVNPIVKTEIPFETQGFKTIDNTIRNAIDNDNDKQSDDDFSEQDFDDLPPIVVKNEEQIPQIPIDTNKIDINEDIFNTSIPKNPNVTQESMDSVPELEENKTEINTNLDDDIFAITEPPVFEKPKEPKRSKNVNALFDDDSDDESLFFKKDDVISDEKPQVFATQDRLFGIFADEPPDDFSDDIFGPKNVDKGKENDIFKSNNEDTAPKETDIFRSEENNKTSKVLESDIFSSKDNGEKSEPDDKDIFRSKYSNNKVKDTDIFTSKPNKEVLQTDDSDIFKTEDVNKTSNILKTDTSSKQDDSSENDDIFRTKVSNVSSQEDNNIFLSKDIKTPKVTDIFSKQDEMSDDNDLFKSKDESTKLSFDSAPSIVQKPNIIVKNKPKEDLDKDSNSDEELFKSPKSHENLFSNLEEKQSEVKEKVSIDKLLNNNNSQEESSKSTLSNKSIKEKKAIFADPSDSLSDDELSTSPKAINDSGPNSLDSDMFQKTEPVIKQEPKKVGKLKIGKLNINVNALLPGASPKKTKPEKIAQETAVPVTIKSEDTDRQENSPLSEANSPVQTENIKTNIPKDNIDGLTQSTETKSPDPNLKTVNFDKELNPEVLDNTLSKDRPKIQVKRRPSTRRARKEAVRKSAIDFGEDSTDNSNSIDDVPKTDEQIDKNINTKENNDNVDSKITNAGDFNKNKDLTYKNEEIFITKTSNTEIYERKNIDSTQTNLFDPKTVSNREVKSKIVYILNDEDIFNTNTEKTPKNNIQTESISTLGSVYKQSTKNDSLKDDEKPKQSLFDDEIFDNKSKTSIFDSDSEDVLFNSRKQKKVEVKKSLFDDDDDDDDLFGVKTKSVEPKPSTSIATKESTLSSEPVFEDPLSMFDSD